MLVYGPGQAQGGSESEKEDRSTPNDIFPLVSRQSKIRDDLHLGREARTKWIRLLSGAQEVTRFLMCRKILADKTTHSFYGNSDTKSYVFIYTSELPQLSAEIERALFCPGVATKVITWRLNAFCPREQVLDVLNKSLGLEMEIRSVVVVSTRASFIELVLSVVATEPMFKWRWFLHCVEWIALTIESSVSLSNENLPDFVTYLSLNDSVEYFHINIHQKSRVEPLKETMQVLIDLDTSASQNVSLMMCYYEDYHGILSTRYRLCEPLNETLLIQYLREDAALYLSTQKSVMAGMRIPAVFVQSEQDRTAYPIRKGNVTSWAGFNIDILTLLSDALGFTALPFPVTDGGFYSVFKPNGEVLGVTGESFISLHIAVFAACLFLTERV